MVSTRAEMVDLNMAPNTKICEYNFLEDCKTGRGRQERKTGKKDRKIRGFVQTCMSSVRTLYGHVIIF